jgi:flavin prenyltransferase
VSSPRPVVIVAITGASGSVYGVRLLELLGETSRYEVHLILSAAGALTLGEETKLTPQDVSRLADVVHKPSEIGASIASGSCPVAAMLVAPCSIKTLSAIATCDSRDLVGRAADVSLKEGRPLLLMLRETPLHLGHLRLMTAAAEAGAIIAPPVPAFYAQPSSLDEMVDYSARRALSRVGLAEFAPSGWTGLR